MQTQDCTYTNDGGSPAVIVSSHCVTVGTTTVAIPAPVEAYNPMTDAFLGITLWVIACIAAIKLILRFR